MANGSGTRPSLRERSRQMATREILETALRLFTEQGYDETTTTQIAREAGVSQRTLFRYFATKEDLVGGTEEQFVALAKEAALGQPADASPWEVLRAAFCAGLALHATPEDALARFRLLQGTDSLRSAYLLKRIRLQEELVSLLEARSAGGPERAQLRALAAAALGCFDAAITTWLERDGKGDVLKLYDAGIASIRR